MKNTASPSASTAASITDAIAAVTHPNPYPWYAALRAGPALVFDPGLRLWIASRAEVVREVLANEAMRVRPAAEPVPRAIAGAPAGEVFAQLVRMNDGAPHSAYKPLLQHALAGLDPTHVHAATLEVAARMPPASLADTCFALPVSVVAHLLGFADVELPRVADWMRNFVACLSPLSSEAQLLAASEAAVALIARFEHLVAAQPAPEGTLLAAVQAQAPADRSRPLLANLVGLLSQTCEATAGLLGNSLLALAREPGLRRKLGTRTDLLPALVHEVSRHDPSIQNTRRFVAQSTVVAGVALAPGDAILLVLAAANRDPSLNPAPATFEPMRADRRTLGFGHGKHLCPGHTLALTIASAGVEDLLADGLDTSTLLNRGWTYHPSVNARIPRFH